MAILSDHLKVPDQPLTASGNQAMLEVTDDSGFLALVVPSAYKSYVASDWTFEKILAHFKWQMAQKRLLIFGTGSEGIWNVDVVLNQFQTNGFREVEGPLKVNGGTVLLTNYESLTMAAQFEDVTLPERHQEDLLVSLPDGDYTCRIVQMFDPDHQKQTRTGKSDFVIEMRATKSKIAPWEKIPWFAIDGPEVV